MPQPLTSLLHRLRLLSSPPPEPSSDADLLDRFARLRDETAFTDLVHRHGPMVHNVCRRVLGDAHAAEDSAQAVFLVLARKADALRRPDALSSWLYGVAYRVARKAQGRRCCSRSQGLAGAAEPADPRPDPLAELSARDLLAVLEQEVQRLPEPSRQAVVLCCLEGLSQEETAVRLGCSPGAVKGRLERGRRLLHHRLEKRGLSLSAVLGVAEVARVSAVPTAGLSSIVTAATRFAAGQVAKGTIDVQVVALAEGVLRAMFLNKLKITAGVLLTIALAGTAAGVLTLAAAKPTAPLANTPKTDKDKADATTSARIRKLQVERRDTLKKELETRQQEFRVGRATIDTYLETSSRLLEAELDLATTAQQRIAAHAAHLKLAKDAEENTAIRHNAGQLKLADLYQARAARMKAEIDWLKAGGKDKDRK
jgi:RNA polymerase sigma factor (sigma-70 family)